MSKADPESNPGIIFTTAAERFGWNLRIARQWAGLKQYELAERINRPPCQVALWESGRNCPRLDSIVRLAEALDIDPRELVRETGGLAG
jgi:ribosome-binding protein aMBF1 (putative translation factor)